MWRLDGSLGSLGLSVGLGLLVSAFFSGCAANPEESQTGSCTLDCSNRRLPGEELVIEPLNPAPGNEYSCQAGGVAFPGPYEVRYRVYRPVEGFGGGSGGGGGTGGGGGGSGGGGGPGGGGGALQGPNIDKVGVPSVGFQPWITAGSGIAVSKTNQEHCAEYEGENCVEAKPYRFRGVVTPKSEWCSDSCGVITYEIWLRCPGAPGVSDEVQAGVAMGNAKADEFIKVEVSNDAEEED